MDNFTNASINNDLVVSLWVKEIWEPPKGFPGFTREQKKGSQRRLGGWREHLRLPWV